MPADVQLRCFEDQDLASFRFRHIDAKQSEVTCCNCAWKSRPAKCRVRQVHPDLKRALLVHQAQCPGSGPVPVP